MMRCRVATYNIHRCIGMDGVEDWRRIAAVVQEMDADVVALQEVSSLPGGPDDVLAYLASITGMAAVEGFTMKVRGARYGNALLSRLPVASVNPINISVEGREPRGIMAVVLGENRRQFQLWATHLGLGIRERRMQTDALLSVIEAADTGRRILLGDFNEWLPWGRPIRKLQRLFAPVGTPATFPANRPILKLDRIWVRPLHGRTQIRVHRSPLSRVASDHLPLVADIVFSG